MGRTGALAAALTPAQRSEWPQIGQRGLAVVREQYDLRRLKQQYLDKYAEIAGQAAPLPRWNLRRRLRQNLRGVWRRAALLIQGQSE